MKFFKPQIQLARERQLDAPSLYYVHVVTFCPRTSFRADGHTIDDEDLHSGLYRVTVNLLEDTTLPDMEYITPVVHTIDLGEIEFPDGEGWIEVGVAGVDVEEEERSARNNNPTTTTKTGGKGTVSTTEAEDKTRPIMANSLS